MKNIESPSISETITWLRQKAAELIRTADTLESVLAGMGFGQDGIVMPPEQHAPTVSDVADVLRKKGAGRAQEIAKRLRASKNQVLNIVQKNKDMFEFSGKGWIKLSQHANGSS